MRLLRRGVEAVTQRTGVHPLRKYWWDEEIGAWHSEVWGFRFRHEDGKFGKPRKTWRAARTDLTDYEREIQGQAVE